MWPHDPVMVDGANDAALTAIVGSAVIVNLHTPIEAETLYDGWGIEDGVKVNPDVAICRPRSPKEHHAAALLPNVFLCGPQVIAHSRVLIQRLQLVLAPHTPVEDAQTIANDHDALVIVRKAATQVCEDLFAKADGFIDLIDRAQKSAEIFSRSHRCRGFGPRKFGEKAVNGAEPGFRRDRLVGIPEESPPLNNLARDIR